MQATPIISHVASFLTTATGVGLISRDFHNLRRVNRSWRDAVGVTLSTKALLHTECLHRMGVGLADHDARTELLTRVTHCPDSLCECYHLPLPPDTPVRDALLALLRHFCLSDRHVEHLVLALRAPPATYRREVRNFFHARSRPMHERVRQLNILCNINGSCPLFENTPYLQRYYSGHDLPVAEVQAWAYSTITLCELLNQSRLHLSYVDKFALAACDRTSMESMNAGVVALCIDHMVAERYFPAEAIADITTMPYSEAVTAIAQYEGLSLANTSWPWGYSPVNWWHHTAKPALIEIVGRPCKRSRFY